MKETLEKTTKERLLDAAESLYASNGIRATSLREITTEAKANLAAVNYHFNSKDALTEAVFVRRLGPLNAERLKLLDVAEAAAAPHPPTLEEVLHALIDPTIALWEEHPAFLRVLSRLQFEPDEKLHLFFISQFGEVLIRFKAALTRVLPEVPVRELFWRMHFIMGALVNTWIGYEDLERFSDGICTLRSYRKMVDRLVAFGATALRSTPLPREDEQ